MADRFVLVVMLYVDADKAEAFEAFEALAYAIMAKHGGRLDSRIRCSPDANAPHEVHVVSFPSGAALEAYQADPAYVALAADRAAAIRETTILAGSAAGGVSGLGAQAGRHQSGGAAAGCG